MARSARFRRGSTAAMAVVLTVVIGAMVNVLTGDEFRWAILALAVVALAALASLEWYRASAGVAPRLQPPRLSPEGVVPRPQLVDQVVDLTTVDSDGDAPVIALHGPPGFGKSMVARLTLADPRIKDRFGDRVFWVELRHGLGGSDLAARVLGVAAQLNESERPGIEDPEGAGRYLGQLLDRKRRALLVVDDVWSQEQLEPFLQGGRGCVRLITTRLASVAAPHARLVDVQELSESEALALLRHQLRPLPARAERTLLDLTGGMALAVRLANRFLRTAVALGDNASRAADQLAERVRTHGVLAFDMDG